MIAILFLYKYRENITTDSGKTLSDEAVQSIASVYNNQNMTVTNLNASNQANLNNAKVTGNLNVSGTITGNLAGNVTGNVTGSMQSPNGKYILRLHDDGNLVVYDTTNNNQATWDAFTSISTKKESYSSFSSINVILLKLFSSIISLFIIFIILS